MKGNNSQGAWVIGGTTLIGSGLGMIFLETSALIFIACILIGIGAGLVLAQLVSR
jgi:hypothetical protein